MFKPLRLGTAFLIGSCLALGLAAQGTGVTFPAPSPAGALKQRVGLTDIEISYSRPGMKGRTIFGGIVAYDQVWRTGANNATRLTVSTPVKLNGTAIPAGTYELFTIPGRAEWTIIVHQNMSQWGAYTYDAKNDVARVTARPVTLAEAVETFTIDLNDLRDESATLNLTWEKTRVPVRLEVDVATTLVPQIEAAMAAPGNKPNGFYFSAAQFYFDHNLDLQKALAWINRATDNPKPAFYMVHLKARILARLGDKPGALAAAQQSTELAIATEGPQSGFVKMNNDLVASLR